MLYFTKQSSKKQYIVGGVIPTSQDSTFLLNLLRTWMLDRRFVRHEQVKCKQASVINIVAFNIRGGFIEKIYKVYNG